MSKNYSEAYGGYGGVANNAHYVPPAVPDFIPQSPSIFFTAERAQQIQSVLDDININDITTFINNNSGNILLKQEVIDSDLTIDTFSMYTLNNPTEQIMLTIPASADVVNLLNLDGGTF